MTARVPRSKWTVVVLNQAKEGAGAMNDCSIHRNNDWNDEVEHECCCANDQVDGPVPILVQELANPWFFIRLVIEEFED